MERSSERQLVKRGFRLLVPAETAALQKRYVDNDFHSHVITMFAPPLMHLVAVSHINRYEMQRNCSVVSSDVHAIN